VSTAHANEPTPEWVIAEMPPGYQNRIAEIRRLSDELQGLEQFGRLLWCAGDGLTEAARDAFAALGFEAGAMSGSAVPLVAVRIDGGRRLLLFTSTTDDVIERRSQALADVFQVVRELAGSADRVVLVTNTDAHVEPSQRRDAVSADALDLLRRIGANVLAGPTLFALWRLSLQDRDHARMYAVRLHEQDGGTFVLPSTPSR
jgi:hypothetical protein